MAERADTIADINRAVQSALALLDRERDQQIIRQRFGLDSQRQTLEEVGSGLGITRERVRQLEKAAMLRIRMTTGSGDDADFNVAEKQIILALHEAGRASRMDNLVQTLMDSSDAKSYASVSLLCELSDKMQTCTENDKLRAGVALTGDRDTKFIKKHVGVIVTTIKQIGKPVTLDELFTKVPDDYEHPKEIGAMASISKELATLGGVWGLAKWPAVNPRNIRDKIYIILKESGEPMHFKDIAAAIKAQNFVRNNVSEQAIHNELIKDDRFVLIGRGIYALAENGYTKGSITDVITDILKKNGPMYRDDIIREVLKVRKVREATVLLNLQNKKNFVRSDDDKHIYALANQ